MSSQLLSDGAEDSGARGDELEALAAIFGTDFQLLPFESGVVARIAVEFQNGACRASLEARLPRGYPSQTKPEFAVKARAGVSEAARPRSLRLTLTSAARPFSAAPSRCIV